MFCLPSDTKLLLTKNYSKIIIFEKLRNCLKKSFFPEDVEVSKLPQNYEKLFSGNYFRNNFESESTVREFLLTVELLRLQFVKMFIRSTFPL